MLSRYTVEVKSATESDPEATIGYDRPLRTFFYRLFPTRKRMHAPFG